MRSGRRRPVTVGSVLAVAAIIVVFLVHRQNEIHARALREIEAQLRRRQQEIKETGANEPSAGPTRTPRGQ
jgi:hypothetical protein